MKVLHVISGDLWAGAEVQVFTLLTSLQRQPGIQLTAALMNDGELARRLRDCGVPVNVFPEGQLSAWRIVGGLKQLMREWTPDLVHTHRSKENILGSIANALTGNVPSLRTVHGAPENPPRGIRQLHRQFLAWLDRWCGRNLQHRIIAVSADLARKLGGTYGSTPVVVVENGVDVTAVRAAVRPVSFREQEPRAIHVGIVGRLVRVKRVDLFLESAASLKAQEPQRPWRFHIFGDGPLRAELTAQAVALGVDDVTTFHGHRNDVIACMAALDALIICSDHEGLPMTVLEAVTVGTPVIAHATGGLVSVLQEEPSARLVQEHAVPAYVEATRQLLAAPASKSASHTNDRFSSVRNAAAIRAIYDQLRTVPVTRGASADREYIR